LEGKGFSFVEILSPCPTDWGMSPQKAIDWMREKLIPVYPLGVVKDKFGGNG
jgi:2-oxoglutarate ferredoxin oxidoreductase subunit beta